MRKGKSAKWLAHDLTVIRSNRHEADQIRAGKYDGTRRHKLDVRAAFEIGHLLLQTGGKADIVRVYARDETSPRQRHRLVQTCGEAFLLVSASEASAPLRDRLHDADAV